MFQGFTTEKHTSHLPYANVSFRLIGIEVEVAVEMFPSDAPLNPTPFAGSRCETDIDECTSDPCQNGGTCVDQVNGFICRCPPGYTGNFLPVTTANCQM